MTCAVLYGYSMTLSARAAPAPLRPSAFAVLRLVISSTLNEHREHPAMRFAAMIVNGHLAVWAYVKITT
jgi:hypothetical protein